MATKAIHYNFDAEIFHRYIAAGTRRVPDYSLQRIEVGRVIKYLENPVAEGLWRLTATWISGGEFAEAVWKEFERETATKDVLVIRSGKRERRIKVTEEWKKEVKTEVFSRLTFLLTIMKYLVEQGTQGGEDAADSRSEDTIADILLDIIDFSQIRLAFAEQLTYFKDQVWIEGLHPSVSQDVITRHKSGAFILTKGPLHGDELSLISWDDAPLQRLANLLRQLGKVEDLTVMPVFSPEEEAFAPYFQLLGLAQGHLIDQEHLRPLVKKAITNFGEKNYIDAVSSIGLASEDVLTQIFETLYREQLNKGLTLGQLADEIQSRASALTKKKDETTADLTLVFSDIKQALEEGDPNGVTSLGILRKFAAQVAEANKILHQRLEKIGKPERRVSLFPDHVGYAVNDLIRYRNAAAHKSRVPIGPYECRHSAHSFVILYRWWRNEKKVINWAESQHEIVRSCILRSTKAKGDA